MLDKETIEIIAENFAHSYFLHYDLGEWEQILEYGEDIPKIIRQVVKDMQGYNDKRLFKEIFSDIDELKKRNL